jgi:hypothetical protein
MGTSATRRSVRVTKTYRADSELARLEDSMRRIVRLVILVGLLASLLTGVRAAAAGAATAPYCGITWGSLPRTAGTLSQAPLLETRTGQDTCWDRVVFEFNGPVTGYDVRYREVYTEGQGLPMNPYTAGGAVLGVQLYAPAYQENGATTYPGRPGDHVARVLGYQTLRDMMYGGSFEGYTTFAVGVRAQLPFRVFVLAGPGSHSRIVLDVLHRWQQ